MFTQPTLAESFFKGVHGVLESNEQYVHHVTHGVSPLNSAQRAALAAAEQQERMEEAAGDVLMHPSETPVMLENLPSLCRDAVVSIHTFNPCNANTVGGGIGLTRVGFDIKPPLQSTEGGPVAGNQALQSGHTPCTLTLKIPAPPKLIQPPVTTAGRFTPAP